MRQSEFENLASVHVQQAAAHDAKVGTRRAEPPLEKSAYRQ